MSKRCGGISRRWLDLKSRAYWRLEPLLLRAPSVLGKRLSRPQSIYLKLTLGCNARCLHCDVWKHPSSVGEELSTREWKDLIRSLRRWPGPRHMALTGGEALVRRDALELLRFAVEQGFLVEFLSNGYSLTDEVAEEIIRIDPDVVAVSLDAMDPTLHDHLRGREGFFDRAAGAIRSLVHHHRRLGATSKIVVKTVIMDQNLDEMIRIVDWVEELGIARVIFQPILQNYEQKLRLDWYQVPELNDLWIKDTQKAADVIDQLVARADSGAPITNSRQSLELMKAYFFDPASWSRNMNFHIGGYADRYCPCGMGAVDISPNGDVQVCPVSAPIGNMRHESLGRMWRRRPACWKTPCSYWQSETKS